MPMEWKVFLTFPLLSIPKQNKFRKPHLFPASDEQALLHVLICVLQTKKLISIIERTKSTKQEGNSKSKVLHFTAAGRMPASSWQAWVQSAHIFTAIQQ
jgi:hypothetical protein